MKYLTKNKILPLSLTAGILLLDQITKSIIANNWPIEPGNSYYYFFDEKISQLSMVIADVFGNGFLQIIHVRNKAIAFSIGEDLPEVLKPVIFIVVPLLVLGFIVWYFLRTDEFSGMQRWAAAGIIGGGLGNISDRIFRPDGVVDFISVKFYGLFGFDRWPTFNVADSSVVVCCILLIVTMLIPVKKPITSEVSQIPETKEKSDE
ncbi:MAG: signal peptidase II [Treponema sp.]|nr:signal peptidase II [Treponema sp.]MCL2237087.1 signal peptidase II [Treponema sp.]